MFQGAAKCIKEKTCVRDIQYFVKRAIQGSFREQMWCDNQGRPGMFFAYSEIIREASGIVQGMRKSNRVHIF